MKCENCGEECWRDSADVGVGVIYGPWGCSCGWSESEEYNQLTGPKKTETGGVADQYGIVTPVGGDQTFFEGFERVVIDSMADASELISGLIASGKEFRVDGKNGQSFGRVHRRQFVEGGVPVQSIVDIKVLTDGIDAYTGPTLILPPTQTVPVGKEKDALSVAYAINDDLKTAYELGFLAATAGAMKEYAETYFESAIFEDQRLSDLKELVSYNRVA